MNYWLLIVMMIVAVLIVTVVLAEDVGTPSSPSSDPSADRKGPLEHGDF
jgi:preprotein translocase subunit SecG